MGFAGIDFTRAEPRGVRDDERADDPREEERVGAGDLERGFLVECLDFKILILGILRIFLERPRSLRTESLLLLDLER